MATDPSISSNTQSLLVQCLALWDQGKKKSAVDTLIDALNNAPEPQEEVRLLELLGYLVSELGDYPSALRLYQRALTLKAGKEHSLREGCLLLLVRMERFEEAEKMLRELENTSTLNSNMFDIATRLFFKQKRFEEAKTYGIKSLTLKDREACEPPAFVSCSPEKASTLLGRSDRDLRNYVAFSLFGDNPRYLRGILDNLLSIEEFYPDWQMLVYADSSVPDDLLGELERNNAKIEMRPSNCPGHEKLLWRFEVSTREDCGRFLVRDADSVITKREMKLVRRWIASDKLFHVIRDWWSHSELILAGLWGGVAGNLPELEKLVSTYKSNDHPNMHFDQHLLRATVWPIIRENCMTHDLCFEYRSLGSLRPKQWDSHHHIGSNLFAARQSEQNERLQKFRHVKSLKL
ncbi:tetratricopeptide repeat protein [Kiloniella sp. b19]|uniref:tetratricopeptide repeat protein n=1 Tax=Kiloniella sp. GXU_MW_B19 TaxID=3141326 RepID=UPI0031D7CCD2